MERKGSEDKDLADPTFNLSDLMAQLTGGSLRWLATVLGVASLGLFLFFAFSDKEPEIDYPYHFKGKAVFWIVGGAFFVWFLVAIVNWKNWLQKRRQH